MMNDADREILDHFTRIRAKTIELARRVPEDLLARTPEGERSPLLWLFVHIADGPDWWLPHVLRDGGTWQWPPPYGSDRESLLQGLAACRDRFLRFFEADGGQRMGQSFPFTEEDGTVREYTGRDRVLYLTDHEVHHRGKIVLALRQWGFEDIPFMP